jgi:hypothetical protein
MGSSVIRILLIDPALCDAPLTGHLVRKTLDQEPVYDALSYTRGNPERCCTISVDEALLCITSNLNSALI